LADTTNYTLPDWPRAHGGVSGRALLRQQTADFRVTELLGFEPSGDGEHDFLYVEKTGLNTPEVARELARHAGIHVAAVGYAGLKDRQAVTRQWFSVQSPPKKPPDWQALARDGVRILETGRHRRKLKRGAHRGNHFELVLRQIEAAPDKLDERLDRIANHGVPNYFGEQRFGRDASNLDLARQLFSGRRLPRERRSLALSAARSLIFNEVLAERVRAGSWNRLLPGDVANLDGSGSIFAVDALDEELERRAEALDIHPTGPLWGKGRRPAPAAEAAIAALHAELAEGLERWVDAARRPMRVRPTELRWRHEDESLVVEFALPSGAYATAVVRELVRYDD